MSSPTHVEGQQVVEPGRTIHITQLEGVSGRLGIQVSGETVGTIQVNDGEVSMHEGDGQAEAVLVAEDRADVKRLASGELNPIVASIQGRAAIRGDLELAVRIILALNAARVGERGRSEA